MASIASSEMVRSVEGLSTKVLNECLKRNVEFGILEWQMFQRTATTKSGIPSHHLLKFLLILDQLESLQTKIGEIWLKAVTLLAKYRKHD